MLLFLRGIELSEGFGGKPEVNGFHVQPGKYIDPAEQAAGSDGAICGSYQDSHLQSVYMENMVISAYLIVPKNLF